MTQQINLESCDPVETERMMESLEQGNFSRRDLAAMLSASARANAVSSCATAPARPAGQGSKKKGKRGKKGKKNKKYNAATVAEELASLSAEMPEIPVHWYADPLPVDIIRYGSFRPTQLWGWRTDLENLAKRGEANGVRKVCEAHNAAQVKEFVEMRSVSCILWDVCKTFHCNLFRGYMVCIFVDVGVSFGFLPHTAVETFHMWIIDVGLGTACLSISVIKYQNRLNTHPYFNHRNSILLSKIAGHGLLASCQALVEFAGAAPDGVKACDNKPEWRASQKSAGDNNRVAGATPMWMAAMNAHARVVAYLLSLGANPYLETDVGMGVLHIAVARGHSEVC